MIIFQFLTYFIIFCFVYDRLTRKYLNPYKLIMVFGKKGSGKTTFLTKIAINSIKQGKKVYSTIDIPGTYKFEVEKIGDYTFEPQSVILIDEVGMIWDNRDFKTFRKEVRDYFKFQRQYKNTVYLFSQTFDVDLKLRNLTDEMYLLSNKFRIFSIARRINKNITIQRAEEGSGRVSQLVDNYEFAPLFSHRSLIVTFIPRWVSFFKSYDPKKLNIIDSIYLEFTDDQQKAIKTSSLIYTNICNKLLAWFKAGEK